jgi:peptidoglycan/xylan/chitin deacetylase (PgdA/CDA1 family)
MIMRAARIPPAVIHVDLDGLVEIYRTRGWVATSTRDSIYETGLRAALDLFEREKITATLFLIADSLDDPAKRELVDEAIRRGHEIACHTMSHRVLTQLSSADKQDEIERGRKTIEDRLGIAVSGFRAPGYRLDRESADLLEANGFAYDASAFPTRAFAERLEVPITALQAPSRPFTNGRLIELPMPDYRPLPTPFNPSYALLLGMRYFQTGLTAFRRRGTPLVLLFHLIDFSSPVAPAELRGLRSRLFTLSTRSSSSKMRACERILALVREKYAVTTTATVLQEFMATTSVAGVA